VKNRAFIALGSNLAEPKAQVQQAVEAIALLGEISALSSLYQSTAIGPGEQPDYINAVLELRTDLHAIALLDALQAIENKQGRVRDVRFGARTLDLDIVLFNQQSISQPRLEVPHPRMLERNFVLTPLQEICPELQLPNGETLALHCARLDSYGLVKLP
jgi:2-amino-4-hydroxy-6-hydroxymethyldihydropteridine diphosphokinase